MTAPALLAGPWWLQALQAIGLILFASGLAGILIGHWLR